jgi:hypothetical protein
MLTAQNAETAGKCRHPTRPILPPSKESLAFFSLSLKSWPDRRIYQNILPPLGDGRISRVSQQVSPNTLIIQNSQAVWFELTNLIMGVEGNLALAKAYKALEPSQEPSFDDDAALNELFYIHGRKISLLNSPQIAGPRQPIVAGKLGR